MKRVYVVFLLVLLASCTKNVVVNNKTVEPNPFAGPIGSLVSMQYPRDANGYYLVPLDATASYTRFNVYVEATKVKSRYKFNGVSGVQAHFDCNSYWLIANSLAVTIPLYSPFTSLSTNPFFNTRMSVRDTTVILSQFKNTMVPLVPPTGIYLKDYFAGSFNQPPDEYMPTDTATRVWSKRIIGPIPRYFKGDTIKVYCKISWDVGQFSVDRPDLTNRLDSIKIIFR